MRSYAATEANSSVKPVAKSAFHCGLTPTQQTANRALARTRAAVERGVARRKSWRILRHARCSPNRLTSMAKAVLTLERHR